MKLSDFDYNLPRQLIAQAPITPRDHSRLLMYDRKTKKILHLHFYRCVEHLNRGDVLVLNDTKVLPARILARKITPEGEPGRVYKVLLVRKSKSNIWQCLIEGKKRKIGQKLWFSKDLSAKIISWDQGEWGLKFNQSGKALDKALFKLGEMPLPPYIKKSKVKSQKSKVEEQYQTIYAKELGSVAAPTAGFHFTKKLLAKIKQKGIRVLYLTLHVGPATFLPITADDLKKHKMHTEFYEIKKAVWQEILRAKKQGHRVVAVGTTTTRVLEHLAVSRPRPEWEGAGGRVIKGQTNIFIYPPYKFKIVDSLITNFHLPRTTLLALVAAFLENAKSAKGKNIMQKPQKSGIKIIKKLYREAIKKKYRFYSFGDAMFIK